MEASLNLTPSRFSSVLESHGVCFPRGAVRRLCVEGAQEPARPPEAVRPVLETVAVDVSVL